MHGGSRKPVQQLDDQERRLEQRVLRHPPVHDVESAARAKHAIARRDRCPRNQCSLEGLLAHRPSHDQIVECREPATAERRRVPVWWLRHDVRMMRDGRLVLDLAACRRGRSNRRRKMQERPLLERCARGNGSTCAPSRRLPVAGVRLDMPPFLSLSRPGGGLTGAARAPAPGVSWAPHARLRYTRHLRSRG